MGTARRRLSASLTVPALVLALSLAGCGSDEKAEGPLTSETPSASSSSPAASPSTPPSPPPAPQGKNSEKNRKAFAAWFVGKAFPYAFGTNDAQPIMAVASQVPQEASCGTCVAFEQFLAKREDKGITLQPSEYHIKRIFGTGRIREDIWLYTVVSRRPAWADIDESGKRTDGRPEDKAYPIDVAVRYHDGAFELAGWKAGEGNKQ